MRQPTSFLEPAGQNIRNMINESLVFSKRIFIVRKGCVYAVKPVVVLTRIPTSKKLAAKGSNKRTLEDCGDGPLAKYRKVLDEFINVTSTNRGFELLITVWLLMNRPKRACFTFIQREL